VEIGVANVDVHSGYLIQTPVPKKLRRKISFQVRQSFSKFEFEPCAWWESTYPALCWVERAGPRKRARSTLSVYDVEVTLGTVGAIVPLVAAFALLVLVLSAGFVIFCADPGVLRTVLGSCHGLFDSVVTLAAVMEFPSIWRHADDSWET
jgi:hypothetical protein